MTNLEAALQEVTIHVSNEMLQPAYGYLHRIEAVHDLISSSIDFQH